MKESTIYQSSNVTIPEIANSCFYPLITNFWIAIHGYNELLSRGTISMLLDIYQRGQNIEDIVRVFEIPPDKGGELLAKGYKEIIANGPQKTTLLFDINAFFKKINASINIEKLALDTVQKHKIHMEFIENAGLMTIISAYEMTKDYLSDKEKNESPIWQFFRHTRNAAGHNGLIYLNTKEPRYTAEWGKHKIQKGDSGKPIFTFKNNGYMDFSDIISLMLDIERQHPDIGNAFK